MESRRREVRTLRDFICVYCSRRSFSFSRASLYFIFNCCTPFIHRLKSKCGPERKAGPTGAEVPGGRVSGDYNNSLNQKYVRLSNGRLRIVAIVPQFQLRAPLTSVISVLAKCRNYGAAIMVPLLWCPGTIQYE